MILLALVEQPGVQHVDCKLKKEVAAHCRHLNPDLYKNQRPLWMLVTKHLFRLHNPECSGYVTNLLKIT